MISRPGAAIRPPLRAARERVRVAPRNLFGLGLDREYVTSLRGLLPATRFAVDAYVRFVREKSLLEAIASSLTELFSPVIISERIEGMLANYDFVTRETLAYFDKRPPQAKKDSDFALGYCKESARTPEQQ